MVSYLTRIVGIGRLDLAEDAVQDVLCRAMEIWPIHGLPDNPSAWLMRVARNRAIDLLRRDERFRYVVPELTHLFSLREAREEAVGFEHEIRDDQLRLMFSCCHPELSTESQVTLILKTLCGFSVSEIAHALLASEESIQKRLGRAHKLFRTSDKFSEVTDRSDIPKRLETVYQAIYLLFNEGYHGSQCQAIVREEICWEAIRLALLLSEHPDGDRPKTYALLALLCFHAARLSGRMDEDGDLIQLETQDRTKWDRELIGRGFHYLEKASTGSELNAYHLQAGIAALHCAVPTYNQTNWTRIVALYDMLFELEPSPVVALNRAVALGKAEGAERGLAALYAIRDSAKLEQYPFYPAAKGEFLLIAGRRAEAATHFEDALKRARSPAESNFFERKLRTSLEPGP